MKLKVTVTAVAAALPFLALTQNACADGHTQSRSVEFIGMPAPATVAEKADIYTGPR